MKTSYKTEIEDSVIRNLLSAHKGLADDGKLDDLLKLTKVLWKLRNKIGNKMIEVISEEVEDKQNTKPNDGKKNIAQFKSWLFQVETNIYKMRDFGRNTVVSIQYKGLNASWYLCLYTPTASSNLIDIDAAKEALVVGKLSMTEVVCETICKGFTA